MKRSIETVLMQFITTSITQMTFSTRIGFNDLRFRGDRKNIENHNEMVRISTKESNDSFCTYGRTTVYYAIGAVY